MGEVVKFPKPDADRDAVRLIQEARAICGRLPTERGSAGVQQDTPAQT